MDRHEQTCSSKTKFRYKETEYGDPTGIREALEENGVLSPDFEIPFITYDIETISCEETFKEKTIMVQKPITIAYFDGVRGDVFHGDGLVEKFLQRMNEIQVKCLILTETLF